MKRRFDCGHTGKGKYCHACEASQKQKDAERAARESRRAAKAHAAETDAIDLSAAAHLSAVQEEARLLLARVREGTHPFALKGKPIRTTNGRLLSVPVGRSYRLVFEAESLRPLGLLSHETYNNYVDTHCP
jgi:hypothetical protein